MDEKYIKLLITKFWDGTASTEECMTLLKFLESTDFDSKIMEAMVQPNPPVNNLKVERKEAVLQKIAAEINRNTKPHKSGFNGVMLRKIYKYAAVIAILFTTFIAFEILRNEKPGNIEKSVATIKVDTVLNKSDDIKSVSLPDKSTILLYPNSSICFEHTFKNRNIILKGKALFRVMHDEKSIFSVTTGDIMTTDIGTEFEIDALEKGKISVHLLSGKIKVGKAPASKLAMLDQYLMSGETLRINAISGEFTRIKPPKLHKTNEVHYKQQLVFNKTPLKIVFSELEKKYNTIITFNDSGLSKLTFTGNVEPKDSLSDILNTICFLNNLKCHFKTNGRYIIKQD